MRLLKSLARGLEALDFLLASAEPVRLTEVAARLGVAKSNASHLLRTLVASGYAEQADGRRYRASARVRMPMGPALEDIIAYRARLHGRLEKLVALTGECAHMAVLVGTNVWYVDKIDSTLPLKVDHPIGSLAPLHCTALGKAFLAFGEVADPGPLDAYTAKSITRKAALEAEIVATRKRGYAVDDEEFTQGIRCVAVPIFDPAGKMVAAIGVSGPTARISDIQLAGLGRIVIEQASNPE